MQSELISSSIISTLALTEANAHILGSAFWNIVKLYDLSRIDQAILLGVNPNNRQLLKSYEDKKKIPLDADKFLRVSFLLGIHKNLRILFPQNQNVIYNWLTTKQKLFHNQTPMQFIASDPANSLLHLATVRRALDLLRTSF